MFKFLLLVGFLTQLKEKLASKLLGTYTVPNCILIFDMLRNYEELVLILSWLSHSGTSYGMWTVAFRTFLKFSSNYHRVDVNNAAIQGACQDFILKIKI